MQTQTTRLTSSSEQEIRKRFHAIYQPLVEAFFEDLEHLNLSEKELMAVPSLFLPACGYLYGQALVKVAVIGESTLRWHEDLFCDLQRLKNGTYDFFASFSHYQGHGPTDWQNPFWKYHAEVLETIYSRRDALSNSNPLFSGIAWGNCSSLEIYRKSGSGVNTDVITENTYAQISALAWKHRISGVEFFVEVFRPDIIIYTCRNDYMSDRILQTPGVQLLSEDKQPEGWVIKVWKYKQTKIIQTQHPSWLRQYRHVSYVIFGSRVAQMLMQLKCFAPIGTEKHYSSGSEDSIPFFIEKLNAVAKQICANSLEDTSNYDFLRTLSYKLLLSLALELHKQKSTMTAVLACKLLNQVDIFKENNWCYALERRGPCSTIRGAWNRFDSLNEKEHAAAIAEAFTKLNGNYAWE